MSFVKVKMSNLTQTRDKETIIQSLTKLLEMNYATDNVLVINVDDCGDIPYSFIRSTFGKLHSIYGEDFKKSVQIESSDTYLVNKFKSAW